MQAVIQYGKIVSWLEMEYGLSEKESKASESFLLAAFLNLAMCYLKLREYTKAVECCDKVGGHLRPCATSAPVRLFMVSMNQDTLEDGAFYGYLCLVLYTKLLTVLITVFIGGPPSPGSGSESRQGESAGALCMLGKHYH